MGQLQNGSGLMNSCVGIGVSSMHHVLGQTYHSDNKDDAKCNSGQYLFHVARSQT